MGIDLGAKLKDIPTFLAKRGIVQESKVVESCMTSLSAKSLLRVEQASETETDNSAICAVRPLGVTQTHAGRK